MDSWTCRVIISFTSTLYHDSAIGTAFLLYVSVVNLVAWIIIFFWTFFCAWYDDLTFDSIATNPVNLLSFSLPKFSDPLFGDFVHCFFGSGGRTLSENRGQEGQTNVHLGKRSFRYFLDPENNIGQIFKRRTTAVTCVLQILSRSLVSTNRENPRHAPPNSQDSDQKYLKIWVELKIWPSRETQISI